MTAYMRPKSTVHRWKPCAPICSSAFLSYVTSDDFAGRRLTTWILDFILSVDTSVCLQINSQPVILLEWIVLLFHSAFDFFAFRNQQDPLLTVNTPFLCTPQAELIATCIGTWKDKFNCLD